MSGYSPDLLQDKGIFVMGKEVLIKPIHPLDLVRKVRAMLDLSPKSKGPFSYPEMKKMPQPSTL